MVKRPIGLTGLVLLVLGVTWIGRTALAADAPSCGDCHERSRRRSPANPHGRGPASCPATRRARAATATGRPTWRRAATSRSSRASTAPTGAETCLTCHDVTTEHTSYRNGVHGDTETVNCLTCHSVHTPHAKEPKLLAKRQTELCASCHQTPDRPMRSKAYVHHLDRGGFTCASCHEPHGRKGEGALKLTRQGDLPCLGCHAEKRGPYVYEHLSPRWPA